MGGGGPTHSAAHEDGGLLGPFQPGGPGADCKGAGNVGHELHGDAHCLGAERGVRRARARAQGLRKAAEGRVRAGYRDQVDKGHSIVADAPQGHEAHGVHEDHDNGE